MGDHQQPVRLLWRLPARTWLWRDPRGDGDRDRADPSHQRIAQSARATPVLGAVYLVATLFPIIVGFTCMNETLRPGLLPLAIIGLAVAGASVVRLLRVA